MKKVLVTGGAGFIGTEVVRLLIEQGFKVRVVDDLSKRESKISKKCDFIKVDLTNPKFLRKAFQGIDYCIHLAAKIGGIGYFHKYPATILSENNKMYSMIFEACVKEKIKKIIYISSSMVFESATSFPVKEGDLAKIPTPLSAYGFSKLIGEEYCKAFLKEYGLDYVICRPFNAYGINEVAGEEVGYAHVIPDLIKKILTGQYPVEILGDGNQTRSFTHVSDIASGIIKAMMSPKALNNDFNLGSAKEIKIITLAKLIYQLAGEKKPFKAKFVKGFQFDIKRRVPSSQKAHKILGWSETRKIEDEIPKIINWMSESLKIKK